MVGVGLGGIVSALAGAKHVSHFHDLFRASDTETFGDNR